MHDRKEYGGIHPDCFPTGKDYVCPNRDKCDPRYHSTCMHTTSHDEILYCQLQIGCRPHWMRCCPASQEKEIQHLRDTGAMKDPAVVEKYFPVLTPRVPAQERKEKPPITKPPSRRVVVNDTDVLIPKKTRIGLLY